MWIFWYSIAGRGTDRVHYEYSDFLLQKIIAGVHCEYSDFLFQGEELPDSLRVFWFTIAGNWWSTLWKFWSPISGRVADGLIRTFRIFLFSVAWRVTDGVHCEYSDSYCRERNWQSTLRIFWFTIAGRGIDRVHCEYPRRRKTRLQDSYSTYIYLPVSTCLS